MRITLLEVPSGRERLQLGVQGASSSPKSPEDPTWQGPTGRAASSIVVNPPAWALRVSNPRPSPCKGEPNALVRGLSSENGVPVGPSRYLGVEPGRDADVMQDRRRGHPEPRRIATPGLHEARWHCKLSGRRGGAVGLLGRVIPPQWNPLRPSRHLPETLVVGACGSLAPRDASPSQPAPVSLVRAPAPRPHRPRAPVAVQES